MTGADRIVGIFGGTFDPIHCGHLRALDAVLAHLPVDVIHVIPASVPPLRPQPVADAGHRVKMVELAIAGKSQLVCDRREIDREGVSYTVLTLEEMQREMPRSRLAVILGRDAFDKLPRWHRFEELRRLADIVVINRPGFANPAAAPAWMNGEAIESELDPAAPPGRVVAMDIPPSDISATGLRRRLAGHGDVTGMLPKDVYSYIRVNRLYA